MKRFAAVCLAAGLVIAVAGCHNSPSPSPSPAPPQTAPTAATPLTTLPYVAPAKVAIYVLNPKATTEESVLIPHEVPVRHPQTPVTDAVQALLKAPHSPLAPGVSLRGLSVDNGSAILDFSASPIKEGGEGAQSAGLNSLALTLGQFQQINTYQIKVQGEDAKSFGEFTADGPMEVTRPDAPLEAKGSL